MTEAEFLKLVGVSSLEIAWERMRNAEDMHDLLASDLRDAQNTVARLEVELEDIKRHGHACSRCS